MQGRWLRMYATSAALIMLSAPGAEARDTSEMQFIGNAFADLEQLIPPVLAACSQAAPEVSDRLRDAYDELRTYHLPYQADVRDGAVRVLSASRNGQTMLAELRNQARMQLASRFFPKDDRMLTRSYCTQQLPEFLRGHLPMMRFRDYADELKQYGTFKVFLAPDTAPGSSR